MTTSFRGEYKGIDVGRIGLPSAYKVLVVTVGTSQVRASDTSIPCRSMPFVRAKPDNTAAIHILETLVATTGWTLEAGDYMPVPIDDLMNLFLVAEAAAQSVLVLVGVDAS